MGLPEKIKEIVEQMPEKNQALVFELVKTMIDPDDILTDEDIADIKEARAERAQGIYTRFEDVKWD